MAPWGPSVFGTQGLPLLLLSVLDGAWAVLSSVCKVFPLWKPQRSLSEWCKGCCSPAKRLPGQSKEQEPLHCPPAQLALFLPCQGLVAQAMLLLCQGQPGAPAPPAAAALTFLWLLLQPRPSNATYRDLYAGEAGTRAEAGGLLQLGSLIWETLSAKVLYQEQSPLCRNKPHTWPGSEAEMFPAGHKAMKGPLAVPTPAM